MILTLLIVSVLISGCAPKEESAGQMDYEATKKMVVDIFKTDDGKKALQEVMKDEEMKQVLVMDQKVVTDTIQSTLQFNFTSSQSMASYFGAGYSYGNFLGLADKFIGLQFNIGPSLYYGWARFDVDATASQFTIKDYAYNAVPDAYILAGEMPVGIAENSLLANTSIYSSNKSIFIQFLTTELINANVKITNSIGQLVYTAGLSNKENTIDLSKEKSGIYFVTIAQDNIVYTKKVYIH